MGTFHDDTDPLHGITVVAECGTTVYVGRCHERDETRIVLLDADEHSEGQDGRSNRQYLERAARFGVWKTHERLVLPASGVSALTPLSEFHRRTRAPEVAVAEVAQARVALAGRTEAAGGGPGGGDDGDSAVLTRDELAGEGTGSPAVTLTDAARSEVRRLLAQEKEPDHGLRLAVSGGGCSGLVYKVTFDVRKDGDLVVAEDGFDVYLDRKSTIYLRGTVLDFQAGLMGRGFQFQNPNAGNTCGCGESFSV